MNKIQVVGLGALNIDHIYEVERIVVDSEAMASSAASFPGGSAANTISGLARLGIRTGFVGAIGDDDAGRMLLADFQGSRVDTAGIRTKPGMMTGTALCLSDGEGRRSLYILPGANSGLSPDDVDFSYINQSEILHVSSFADAGQLAMLNVLMSKLDPHVKVSFAPGALYAARGLTALTTILARTHVLFLNQEEIRQLTGEDIRPGAQTAINHGCHTVAVTLGRGATVELDDGGKATAACYIRDAAGEYFVEPGPPARPVDATGAGDAFAAGFLYGLLRDKTALECGRLGDIAARFGIEKSGAREGLPTLETLTGRYQELYSVPR